MAQSAEIGWVAQPILTADRTIEKNPNSLVGSAFAANTLGGGAASHTMSVILPSRRTVHDGVAILGKPTGPPRALLELSWLQGQVIADDFGLAGQALARRAHKIDLYGAAQSLTNINAFLEASLRRIQIYVCNVYRKL